MISSHGRSGLNRWVYGSVAERVLRQAPCATSIINARVVRELPQCTKILVPLDGSDLAERALVPGKQLASAIGADLYLLRVATSAHQLMDTSSMREVLDEIEDKEAQEAEGYLKSKYLDVSDGTVFFDVEAAKGTVAESIVNYAAEHQIDMIVMSSHGRTGLQRWVYGSVAEKVLRSACCATMIIRDKI
jgi:nucleotide-binding universal stress UspA family protein